MKKLLLAVLFVLAMNTAARAADDDTWHLGLVQSPEDKKTVDTRCDNQYSECVDKAVQKREECGEKNQRCLDDYKKDAKVCMAASEACENPS